MALLLDSNTPIGPDPNMVDMLVIGMGKGLSETIIPEVTTDADLISATFAVLHGILLQARNHETNEAEHENNSKEIERVLLEFLLEFGTSTLYH